MITLAGYKVFGKISETVKTIVYRGESEREHRSVLIKILKNDSPNPQDIANLRQEYEIAKSLDLEEIVKPYALEKNNNRLALILEDFKGESLRQYIDYKKIDLSSFLLIATSTSKIIGNLHELNIIHKNIQPQNILINPDIGQLKITDFSIASRLSRENQAISISNYLECTLAYMSPEQTGRMNRVIDYRTDFYSLGVTFYEMLTGQLPFQSTDPMELVHCHIAKQPPSPYELNSQIPEAISNIVMKLLAKTAEDRYQSAYGLKVDLETCLTQWQDTGKITNILLGQQDISPKFQIPQKLYGREQEIITLMNAFDRVSQGATEIVLVSGYSGIGKSALVNEIHKPIVRQRGYFISGKFDQFQRNIPYASLIQAFQQLIRQLLTESQEKIEIWQESLLNAFGSNGQVIIDVIPEVELIIGSQPPVPQLEPAESQNRFNLVFQKFLGVFSKKEHPLVLFLDDLQWADSASLKLLRQLMTNSDSQCLLLIGAYRDNEVSAAHPLMLTLDDILKAKVKVNTITLQPLDNNNVSQLIADSLHCDIEKSKPLTELLLKQTGGNPFFLTQLLTTLTQEQLLEFNFKNGCWNWDIQQIQARGITDNVIELMVNKIQKLAQSTQNVLKIAACIGNTFDLNLLAIVNEKSMSATAAELWEALQEGLILPLSNAYKIPLVDEPESLVTVTGNDLRVSYKFLHDRVQQATYSLLSEQQKKQVHLRIGRLILKNISEEQREEKIFDIVNSLNFGVEFITSSEERYELAKLNLTAGQKAKASNAYETALRAFNRGLEVLPGDIWQEHYELTFDLYKERSECEYLCGNFNNAEEFLDTLLKKAKSQLEKAEIYTLKVMLYSLQHKAAEAIDVGLQGLKMLGLNVPHTEENLQAAIATELEQVESNLKHRNLEDLINAPSMRSLDKQAVVKLLFYLGVPTYQLNKNLFTFNVLKMLNLSLEYGFTKESPDAFCNYALIAEAVLGDYETAYKFGNFALKLNEKLNNSKISAKLNFWYGLFLVHWREHLKSNTNFFIKGYQQGLESGDIAHVQYSCIWLFITKLLLGRDLDIVYEESQKYDTVLPEDSSVKDIYEFLKQVILNFKGLTKKTSVFSDEYFDESHFLERVNQVEIKTILLHIYNTFKLQTLWIFGSFIEALDLALASEATLKFNKGMIHESEHYFYYSLTLTALYVTASLEEQTRYWKIISENQENLKTWSKNCPENFYHKYLLVAAEMARIRGEDLEAMNLYDQAIESAKENEFNQNEAIANELAAKFYLTKGKEKIAKVYMMEARYCYSKWGATAKIKDLDEKYPQLVAWASTEAEIESGTIPSATSSVSGEKAKDFDLTTIVKASQALSSEIFLGKLLAKLLKIVLENAGAQKGFLILKKGEKFFIEAEGKMDDEQVVVLQSIPVEFSNSLPVSIINYVKRTQDDIVLNDATCDGAFTTDTYITTNHPKSLLCTPIIHQGKLTGILYLENNLTTNTFTPDRLEILQLLSSQAAISIENALLYSNLEEVTQNLKISNEKLEDYSRTLEVKVGERTLELQEKNRELGEQALQLKQALQELKQTQTQLIQTEKMSSLGQLVAGVAHEINNPVNFIYGNLTHVNEYTQDLLRLIQIYQQEYPVHPPNIQDEIEAIELDFLQEDLPKILSSMALGANRIRQIVLSLRNFSRLDEAEMKPVNIHEGIDSTLLILQNRLKVKSDYSAIQVIKDYASLPEIECYAGQINQVFMNILTNAIDALDEYNRCHSIEDIQNRVNTISIHTEILDQEQIRIRICDNGSGMKEEVRSRVFDPFFTTKPIGSGTGLGLSISYQIVVEKHGGKLKCLSSVGQGTEFIIEIPVKQKNLKK